MPRRAVPLRPTPPSPPKGPGLEYWITTQILDLGYLAIFLLMVAEMPLARFSLFTIAGSLPWTFALALAGYALAGQWKGVAHAFTPVSIVIGVIAVIGIGWWLIRRRQAAASSSPREPAERT